MIDVVNEHIFGGVYDYSVHSYCQSSFLCFGPLASEGVTFITVYGGVPFVFAQPIVVVRVNDCVFSLGEWDSPEGIAVAQTSVPEGW